MAKWKLLLIMMLIVASLASASLELCEDTPKISTNCTMVTPELTQCTTYNYTIMNTSGAILERNNLTVLNESVYFFNFTHPKGEYIVVLCDGAVREVVVKGDDEMANLSVTLFILVITLGVFGLTFFINRLTSHFILNQTLKGICIIIGLFLLSLDAAMVVTMADNAGIGVTQELFRYLWLINWAAYLSMFIIVLRFGYSIISYMNSRRMQKNYGEE